MRHTHSFLIKVFLPLLLLTSFALPLLPVHVPWYVFVIVVPLGVVASVALIGKALLHGEEHALEKDRFKKRLQEVCLYYESSGLSEEEARRALRELMLSAGHEFPLRGDREFRVYLEGFARGLKESNERRGRALPEGGGEFDLEEDFDVRLSEDEWEPPEDEQTRQSG